MVNDTPRFGPKLDLDEHKHNMSGFNAEMYRFRGLGMWGDHGDMRVNMLHIGLDLAVARPQMDRLTRWMEKLGFEAERETIQMSNDSEMYHVSHETDMIVMGCDTMKLHSARYILQCVGRGWFGLIPYWDLLLYDSDNKQGPDKVLGNGPTKQPIRSGHKFFGDCACLTYAHIYRRNDEMMLEGFFVSKLKEVERCLDRWPEVSSGKCVSKKLEKFKGVVKDNGHYGRDADLFFAAANMVRNWRNTIVHGVGVKPKSKMEKGMENDQECISNFNTLADGHGPVPLKFDALSVRVDGYTIFRWMFRISHMTVAWLDEYSKLYGKP